jgi:4-hydroxybenzoate polyprenyltransferase
VSIVRATFDESAHGGHGGHGGHVAALMLASLVFTFGLLRGTPLNPAVLAIAYLIPLIIYAYNYYEELNGDRLTNPDWTSYLDKRVKIYPFLISGYVATLATLVILYNGQLSMLYAIVGILLVVGVLYTTGLKGLTRYVPGFKSYFVTAEWALAATILCTLVAENLPEKFPLFTFVFVFCRILVNAIYFDLKDVRSDVGEGLQTVPVVLGRRRTIRLLYLFNLLSPVPLFLGVLTSELPGVALVLVVFTFFCFYYLRQAETAGEEEMVRKDYAIADYEIFLWPWAAGIGLVLLDWLGPYPLAAIVTLISMLAAVRLFTGRAAGKNPHAGSPP